MNTHYVKLYKKFRALLSTIQFYILFVFTLFLKKENVNTYKGSYEKDLINIICFGSVCQNERSTIERFFGKITSQFSLLLYTVKTGENTQICVADRNKGEILLSSDPCLIDLGKEKIGLCYLTGREKTYRQKIDILIKLHCLKKRGATFLIAYTEKREAANGQTPFKRRLIARYGFDCVIGIENRVKGRDAVRTLKGGESRILYSLGSLNPSETNDDEEDTKGLNIIAYGFKLSHIKRKCKIVQEGYIPLGLYYDSNGGLKIKSISGHTDNPEEKKILSLSKKLMYGVSEWDKIFTLKDIFDVLGKTIPQKYNYLADFSVNQICARTYELAPGNIFFFRRQFNDRNDIKPESEILRNRLILRAIMKKSLFIFSYKKLPAFIPHIVVENPTEDHIKVMAWYRQNNIKAKVIAVTGSIGKTSTKDMLKSVLGEKYNTYASVRNNNVQVKIGINLQYIPCDCEVYIQEIGGGRPGGASRHSRMVLPDISVITNIGTAHIGNYDSQEELMVNKLGIADGMPENGVLYLNGDDPLLINAQVSPKYKVVYFALKNKKADYYAENIEEKDGKTYFDIVHNSGKVQASINVIGRYNVLNAVCAYAIAKQLQMDDENIIDGIENFETSGIRQNLVRLGKMKLFIDCYNASAESVAESAEVLEKLNGKRKIAVFGDVTGTGAMQEEINKRVADVINNHDFDIVICFGGTAKNIKTYINYDKNVLCIESGDELEKWLQTNIRTEDTVLFKGSSKMQLDEHIDNVFGLNTSDQRYIDESRCFAMRKNKFKYRVFPDYISVNRYYGKNEKLNMDPEFLGKPVRKLVKGSFAYNKYLEKIVICSEVRHIGDECFSGCEKLQEVVIPESVRYIGERAFCGCMDLEKIEIKGKLLYLGKDAFLKCEKLTEVITSAEQNEEVYNELVKSGLKVKRNF